MKIIKCFFKIVFFLVVFIIIISIGSYFYYSKDLPNVVQLKDIRLQTPLQVLSADGELIAFFGEHRRIPLKYDDIPIDILKAVIATEDSRFYDHFGIDPIGILRSIYIGIKNKKFSQGGSTITQQVAKNLFLTPEKSIHRKIREVILAIKIEQQLTKQEIMALYLNLINFGSRSYGIGSAAYTFFGKQPKKLTLAQSALLAGLPNAPSAYNPIYYPDRALSRRNWVLHRMLEQEFITSHEYSIAINEPLNVSYNIPKIDFSAPYVAEMARQYMYNKYGEKAYTDGYKIYTTISKKEQLTATQTIKDKIINYDINHGYRGPEKVLWRTNENTWSNKKINETLDNYMCYNNICPAIVTSSDEKSAIAIMQGNVKININFDGVKWARTYISDLEQGQLPSTVSEVIKTGQQIWVKKDKNEWVLSQIPSINGSLVSIDANDGKIKAMVGGFHFNLSKFNRATQAVRQIGSTIKPFIYAAALEKGLTMSTILNDMPIMRTTMTNEIWRPKNSPPIYKGPTRLRVGLATSRNVMMVRALRAIGVDYAADYLENFGFPKENISRHESLALGSASFTPLQVSQAYAVITNGGYLITPYLIDRIEYSEGGVIYKHQPQIACSNCSFTQIKTQSIPQSIQSSLNDESLENTIENNELEEPEEQNLKSNAQIILPSDDETNKNSFNTKNYAKQVISSDVAFIIKDALKSAVWGDPNGEWSGTAWRSKSLNRKDIGGKTGTTNSSKDVWFSGFGANIVTTVWLGFDDHKRKLGRARRDILNDSARLIEEGGPTTANPIWNNYMINILKNVPQKEDSIPNNIVQILIDKKTGLLATQPGNHAVMEYFIKGTEPDSYGTSDSGTKILDNDGKISELF